MFFMRCDSRTSKMRKMNGSDGSRPGPEAGNDPGERVVR
jgi:hypothetical protein